MSKRGKKSRNRSKFEMSTKDESTQSTKGGVKTPNAHVMRYERTYNCDEDFTEKNEDRFMKSTPVTKFNQSDQIDPPSLEIHGGWLFPDPDKAYEEIPSGITNSDEEDEGENGEDQKHPNQCRNCCCCCLRRRMLCCGCPINQRQIFMRQMFPCEPITSVYKRQKAGNRRQSSPEIRSNQTRIREDKDVDAEDRCIRDMDLASAYVNRADNEFKKEVDREKKNTKKKSSKRSKKSKKRNMSE